VKFTAPEEKIEAVDGMNKASYTLKGAIPNLKNDIAFLYVFSDPTVYAIQTDDQGAWSFAVPSSLEPGEHKAYIALAKGASYLSSEPITFTVKAAEPIASPSPELSPSPSPTPTAAPIQKPKAYNLARDPLLYSAVAFLILLLGFIVVEHVRVRRGRLLIGEEHKK
jgi:hypothetical protein